MSIMRRNKRFNQKYKIQLETDWSNELINMIETLSEAKVKLEKVIIEDILIWKLNSKYHNTILDIPAGTCYFVDINIIGYGILHCFIETDNINIKGLTWDDNEYYIC